MSENKKRNKDRGRTGLSSAQEVSYQREFKMADKAGGFTGNKAKM